MQLIGRGFRAGSGYRFGFNGKENDNEVKGEGNQQDYGMRTYDPRIQRFPNVDPLTKQYPELTPFQFASNTPVQAIDLDGLEAWIAIYTSVNNQAPTLKMVFDKDIVNPGGLYQIHNYYTTGSDGNNHLTGRTWGSDNYSSYQDYFPNFSKGVRDQFSVKELAKSVNLIGEANILFAEIGLEGIAGGGSLGGSIGANGKIIGVNFDAQDRKGAPLLGWNSVFREGGDKVEIGAGAGLGAGLEYRHKFDLSKSKFLPDNEIRYNGMITSASINTNSKDVKFSWGAGLKAAIGLGFNAEGKIELNMTQLSRALKPLSIKYTEYEKQELKAEGSSKKQEFDANKY